MPRTLVNLLGSLQGVRRIVTEGDPLPPFDYYCPLLSLPLAFGTTLGTLPSQVPYLSSDAERLRRWREKLGEWRNPKVEFYSLQKGEAAEHELAEVKARNWDGPDLIDLTGELDDFADTAALIQQLDLVISVDTSMAHLAGALGKPGS